jgi:hypothetical protein
MKDNKITLKSRSKYAKTSLSPQIFTYFWSKNLKNITTVDFELTFGNANAHGLGFYSYYIEEMVEKKLAGEKPEPIHWEVE